MADHSARDDAGRADAHSEHLPDLPGPLAAASSPLQIRYDVALLDLDGVVYVGGDAVPEAPEALAQARASGMRLAFVTNNAARPPAAVADHLTRLGIPADPTEVITSAQSAAHYLADRLPAGSPVLVIGTIGLFEALRERGLEPRERADEDIAAVVQGYSPDLNWHQLAEGSIGIRRGLPWVATNVDPTVPSARGPLPGNGSLVAALRHATGRAPVVTGKPEPTMHRESVQRSGAQRPIVVGDRLDTDIEGANAAGCASLLVLTGVTSPEELIAAPPRLRPSFVANDLRGLMTAHPAPRQDSDGWICGRWRAEANADTLTLHHRRGSEQPEPGAAGGGKDDGCDSLRALCAAAWSAGAVAARAGDQPSRAELARLGLIGEG